MATKYWMLALDPAAAVPNLNGVNTMVIVAETANDAKAMANSKSGYDAFGVWSNATATEMTAGADMEGWTLSITVVSPAGADVVEVSVTGAASATLDTIGALAVTALNAHALIAGAAYTANVLKIAETTDNLGDHQVYCEMRPPAAASENPIAIPGMLGAVVDGGIVAAVLSQAFAADGYTVPKIVGQCRTGL